MKRLDIGEIFSTSQIILAGIGLRTYVDFLALNIAITTLPALLNPESLSESSGNLFADLVNPVYLVGEALFALLFAARCLEVWAWRQGTEIAPLAPHAVPLVLLSIGLAWAYYIGLLFLYLPGLLLAGLAWIVTPLVVIEGRGWLSFVESVRRCAPHLLPLTGIATAFFAVWLLSLTATIQWIYSDVEVSSFALWLRWLVPDAILAGIGTLSLAVTMAIYEQLAEGPPRRDLDDIFS